jgi:molybdopterin-binding protein
MTKARTLADNFAADINGITAGTGITGGGTSGTVTITNDMATTIAAKGDLIIGTGNDTYNRLAVASTAGWLLSVDSAETTGLKWAAPAAGGKVLQVVEGSTTTQTTINTGTFTDTGITATITPSSATSKILVIVSASVLTYATSGTSMIADTQLLRGATQIADLNTFLRFSQPSNFSDNSIGINGAITKLDSPNTTSATTYKVQARQGGGTIYFNHGSNRSTIILMEVGA